MVLIDLLDTELSASLQFVKQYLQSAIKQGMLIL